MIAGMVMETGKPFHLSDEAGLVNLLGDAVKGKAEEILANTQDDSLPARRLHHLLGLHQQAAHACFDMAVNAVLHQEASHRVVEVHRRHDQRRFHGASLDEILDGVEGLNIKTLGIGIGMFTYRITNRDQIVPTVAALQ